eukprot:gnl/TRDRNA2_/TRDRNA2_37183_c0_seq1.p1 gnl/TRDRNA2_/TRDRNA2_37183_c0~~gnl/TRDRNA2_/TRDRNA2_37183_c0_seq1.p1  ORF type:complete len:427 (-),score=78.67 gnl/TRDRNA2_/TRDRNA2_37183_c0_seq1:90-1370(-)
MGSAVGKGAGSRDAAVKEVREGSQISLNRQYSFGSHVFEPLNAEPNILSLEAQFLHQSLLQWVFLPLFCFLSSVGPVLNPSCAHGFNDWAFLVLLIVEAHHLYAEVTAWHAAKGLCTPPELSILRAHGVLQKRRRSVLLGILEAIDLFLLLYFPYVARACDVDGSLTQYWKESWRQQEVKIGGDVVVKALDAVGFSGFVLTVSLMNVVVSGFSGIALIFAAVKKRKQKCDFTGGLSRIPGEVFFELAASAETAMMPSLALLCGDMGNQSRYTYDSKSFKDTAKATQAREDVMLGKTTARIALQMEMADMENERKVDTAERKHFLALLICKVFIGNVMQLWLQSSFFALSWAYTGQQAKIKMLFSICANSTSAALRCMYAVDKLGMKGIALGLMIMAIVAWSWAKVYFAWVCKDHLWNLTSGCVTET